MRLNQGVYVVLLLLALVFNTLCIGMVSKLLDCAYEQYLTREISTTCDKQYSYNNVRVWSYVYLPNDMISFVLTEGTIIVLLIRRSHTEKPLLLTLTSALSLLTTVGAQLHGLSRHALGDEDYTNFSEAYASFCILNFVCVAIVTIWLLRSQQDSRFTTPDSYQRPLMPPVDPRAELVDAPPAYEQAPASAQPEQVEY
eukprot:scpid86765/ scgid0571/ 